MDTQLENAIQSFTVQFQQVANVPGAVDLLLGLSEEATTRRYPPLVYLANRKFSLPLETLTAAVDSKDTAFGVFQKGQQLLLDAVAGASDYCDGIVLERAFVWAWSCRAAKKDQRVGFKLGPHEFSFHCDDLKDGVEQNCPIYTQTPTGTDAPFPDGINRILDGVLYHVASEGRRGRSSQKGFDFWFKTTDEKLVRSSVALFLQN